VNAGATMALYSYNAAEPAVIGPETGPMPLPGYGSLGQAGIRRLFGGEGRAISRAAGGGA
jgi:hypothetical protein